MKAADMIIDIGQKLVPLVEKLLKVLLMKF
jgi:hypothetical protein